MCWHCDENRMYVFGYSSGRGRSARAWLGPQYSTFNEKSQAAMNREREAKARFDKVKQDMEGKTDLVSNSNHMIQLLKPNCHLTGACWKTFRKYVTQYRGWTVRRRVATPEEKRQSGEKRKASVYFVFVTYTVPDNGDSKNSNNSGNINTISSKGAVTKSTGLMVRDGNTNNNNVENLKPAPSAIKPTPIVSTNVEGKPAITLQVSSKENTPLTSTTA